ncbi:MAG: CBS domain-containing protein [Pseudomonadota bacterium]
MRIIDRAEYASKPKVLTMPPSAVVMDAAKEMTKRGYGSVVITDEHDKLIGIVTERDLMGKVTAAGLDPKAIHLEDIMTREVRVAKADDELIDWLRIMSNERFRRLPIVDDEGKVIAMMTQGDFVSYTWPELLQQAKIAAQAAVGKNYPLALVVGSVLVYSLVLVAILNAT